MGCLGLGWQPWAGLASAPLPSTSQTSICLLTSWPPRPFQFPGRSSVGQWEAVTCPAMATGAKGPLLFWDGRPWSPGNLLGLSRASQRQRWGSAGRLTATPQSRGLRDPAGPSRWRPLLAGSHPAGLGVAGGSSLGVGLRPLACTLLSAERARRRRGTGCLLHQGAGLLLSTVEGLRPTSCKPEKRSLLACPVWLSEALGRSPNGQASVSSLTGLEFRAWFPGRAQ